MTERVRVVIELNTDNGDVQVTGPTYNRILFYGMLEMAREMIVKQAQRQTEAKGNGGLYIPELKVTGLRKP